MHAAAGRYYYYWYQYSISLKKCSGRSDAGVCDSIRTKILMALHKRVIELILEDREYNKFKKRTVPTLCS